MGVMTTITFPTEMRDLPKALIADLKKAARRGLAQGTQIVIGALRQASGGEILQRRTGNLARSWYGTGVETEDDGYAARIGSNAIYARIQNDGGTVKPVHAKALTVPIAANLTDRGVPRYPTAEDLKNKFGEKNVFLLKRAGQAPLLMAKTGKTDRSVKPYFALMTSVKIPASGYIDKTLEAQADTVRSRIATEVFVASVMGQEGGNGE